ncbi:MAG: GNAT family N-acetyltransferase [Pasteurellaceae bacterium]|nr:GNAT family N-acetyltransferase [Pasteurellaceae bacterium]
MAFTLQNMTPAHYDQVYQLWQRIDGVDLNPIDDNPDAIAQFLALNPNLNYVALQENQVIGVIMCGFDGRRATIYHMAVDPNYRGQGIGKTLLTQVEQSLKARHITKGRLLAFEANQNATNFWQAMGWTRQPQLNYFSKNFR